MTPGPALKSGGNANGAFLQTQAQRRDLTTVNALVLSSVKLLAAAVGDQAEKATVQADVLCSSLSGDKPGTVEGVNAALEGARREAFALAELASRTQTRIGHLLAQAGDA